MVGFGPWSILYGLEMYVIIRYFRGLEPLVTEFTFSDEFRDVLFFSFCFSIIHYKLHKESRRVHQFKKSKNFVNFTLNKPEILLERLKKNACSEKQYINIINAENHEKYFKIRKSRIFGGFFITYKNDQQFNSKNKAYFFVKLNKNNKYYFYKLKKEKFIFYVVKSNKATIKSTLSKRFIQTIMITLGIKKLSNFIKNTFLKKLQFQNINRCINRIKNYRLNNKKTI